MSVLKNNGYIIQKKKISDYDGIDGDNWYLNYCSDDSYYQNFFDDWIDKAWEDSDCVDCCSDEMYMRKYIEESKKMGIEYRILLCSTCRNKPLIENIGLGKLGEVLGYDYAYSGGSYYSCILNDIISKRVKEFGNMQLNKNGLFSSYDEIQKFIKCRENLKILSDKYSFEDGDFIIYKITEVMG